MLIADRAFADLGTAAIIEAGTTGVVDTARFPANRNGYLEAINWADGHTSPDDRAWAIEGSASFGRGLTVALSKADERVIEFDWARKKPTKDGAKSDELDAIQAAREILGRAKLNEPRAHDGPREALRVHTVTRASAVRARTAAINELKALVVTAPDDPRSDLRDLTTRQLIAHCCGSAVPSPGIRPRQCLLLTMRALAHRVQHLNTEIASHDKAMVALLRQAAPQLLAQRDIAHVTASIFYLSWSHPRRCRTEAAYARLGRAAPVPATSGRTQNRHRINHGGDRRLNHALYIVAMTRLRCDSATKAYRTRRIEEGKTDHEILRYPKRYIARRVWRLLEHPPTTETGPRQT